VLRPFHLEYRHLDIPDAEERLQRALAILRAAGQRARHDAEDGDDGHGQAQVPCDPHGQAVE
jgi:hypothetical protein